MRKDKKPVEYIEMPLKEAVALHSGILLLLPPFIDTEDEDYIIRISEKGIEVGYAGDDWALTQ